MSLVVIMAAHPITFSSSRTFPGHERCESQICVRCVSPRISLRYCEQNGLPAGAIGISHIGRLETLVESELFGQGVFEESGLIAGRSGE